MMLLSFNSNTRVTNGAGITQPFGQPDFSLGFIGVCDARSLDYFVVFCRSLFSFICMFCWSMFLLLSFFLWPLCCLTFFDLWILFIPLISLNPCPLVVFVSFDHCIVYPFDIFKIVSSCRFRFFWPLYCLSLWYL
jgi:hypothetical protein